MQKNILSLFDGMSCGQLALNRAGIKFDNYYASEVEASSIKVTQHNFPSTIQLGDVRNVSAESLSDIFMLIGGSPCQMFSMCGTKKGMTTTSSEEVVSLERYLELKAEGFSFEGQSYLFWEYVRLLKEVKPKYFLLENVIMKKNWESVITKALGVQPIEINSNLVSAQNRRRLYWTNIPNVSQPKNKGIFIQDIIYDDSYKTFTDPRITSTKSKTKNYVQWDLSGKGYKSQQDRAFYKNGKLCTLPKANGSNKVNIVIDYENDIYRRLHPVEAERCQNVPDNYTLAGGIKDAKRIEMLGNGWTVDVISHIFSHIPTP